MGEEQVDVLIEEGIIRQKIAKGEWRMANEKSNSQIAIRKSQIELIDASSLLLFPRLIDCHVHFREPGYPQKATMKSEAAAARVGGIGTVCDMPNTDPSTVTIAALADKVRRANEVTACDIRFFFGVTKSEHLLALRELWTGTSAEMKRLKSRCCGVKIYFDHSTGDQGVELDLFDEIFHICRELSIPLVGHCEDATLNAKAKAKHSPDGKGPAGLHSLIRPPQSEARAIEHALTLVRKHGTAFHVAHLSTKEGLELVRQAKREGLPVTCEVAPHHLFLSTYDYDNHSFLGTLAKMNPPLRTMDHSKAVWEGIADRTIDCIASDHAPHALEEKNEGRPLDAPSGVPGVETLLPLL
ncbi:dihydroorotase family protein, partial [Candidatus Peregrinibacteria bacterium]|nr:dihydroorotase family protein [Candidatus Peregrinibacteria bacterium]